MRDIRKHLDENIKSAADARQLAIEWQADASQENYDTLDLIEWHEKFIYLGKKYDLTEEFKENGII